MEQHPIPRQITSFEFKIIGFLTLKQFLYLLVACPCAFIVFKLFPIPYVNILLAAGVVGIGCAFAFLPVNDRPLDVWIKNLYKRLTTATQYTYGKNNQPLYFLNNLYFLADPHKVVAHVESQEKLSQYLNRTRPKAPANTNKQQIQSLLQKPTANLKTQAVAPVRPVQPYQVASLKTILTQKPPTMSQQQPVITKDMTSSSEPMVSVMDANQLQSMPAPQTNYQIKPQVTTQNPFNSVAASLGAPAQQFQSSAQPQETLLPQQNPFQTQMNPYPAQQLTAMPSQTAPTSIANPEVVNNHPQSTAPIYGNSEMAIQPPQQSITLDNLSQVQFPQGPSQSINLDNLSQIQPPVIQPQFQPIPQTPVIMQSSDSMSQPLVDYPPAIQQPVMQVEVQAPRVMSKPIQPMMQQPIQYQPQPLQSAPAPVMNPILKTPFFTGIVRNNRAIAIPGILVYVKDQQGTPLRLLKTNPHGVFATFSALAPGDYMFELKDPKNSFFFDTMNITIQSNNPVPYEFRSREIL